MRNKFICECPSAACRSSLSNEVYEAARAVSVDAKYDRLAVVIPGHSKGGKIVAKGDGYRLVDFGESLSRAVKVGGQKGKRK